MKYITTSPLSVLFLIFLQWKHICVSVITAPAKTLMFFETKSVTDTQGHPKKSLINVFQLHRFYTPTNTNFLTLKELSMCNDQQCLTQMEKQFTWMSVRATS